MMRGSSPAGGAGAACAYCSGGAWAASCSPHRFAWRRLTRFETAVAVPETTATRATPRKSPGMVLPPWLGRRFGGVERAHQLIHADALEGDRHAAIAVHRGDERRCPAVLVDDHDCGRAGLDRVRCLLDVGVVQKP